MKTRKHLSILFFSCCLLAFTQQSFADGVSDLEITLSLSGQNRGELEAVLEHYSQDTNKEKVAAAKFLIGNMRWHMSYVPIEKHHHNTLLNLLTHKADSLYYNCIIKIPLDSLGTPNAEAKIAKVLQPFWQAHNKQIENDKLYRPTKAEYDYKALTARELIRHIDHAFYLRDHVSIVNQLPFDDFCEYILPYRSISDYPLMDLPETYLNFLGKYFADIPSDSIINRIKRYNNTLYQIKKFFPQYPYSSYIGYQELFFNGFHDCISIAHNGASIFRMLGIPSAVEYNIAYKQFQGIHYMCSILISNGEWTNFNPESALPSIQQNNDYKMKGSMNVYRFMFSAQKNTPFFLHGKDEFVPDELNSPFIKDVSSRLLPTISLSLPFRETCSNEVAYLATFSSEWDDGLVPVSWAKIDKNKQEAIFNVITERIYFPIYYSPTGKSIAFAPPFYINRSGKKTHISSAQKQTPELYNVTRKFPWKPNMKEYSEKLTGAVVLASNHPSMIPCDTVGYISELLQPYFQDVTLDTCKGPYTYYCIKTPQKSPHAYIAELQFLTSKNFNYSNVCTPFPLPVFQPSDTSRVIANEIRLLDEPLENIKWKAEYDSNPQTAPSAYPTIEFKLQQPQYVTKIRLMPVHADNGIVPGDIYTLLHWKGNQWEDLGKQTAQYNYLPYKIVKGDLYWLQNLSKGKEELLFTVNQEGQQFIYFNIMNN